jgi:hypothetical protein
MKHDPTNAPLFQNPDANLPRAAKPVMMYKPGALAVESFWPLG